MKKFNLHRRGFLLSLAAAGVALGGVYFFGKNTRSEAGRDTPRIIFLQSILQQELPYVVIEQQTVESFYHDLDQDDFLFISILKMEELLGKNPQLLQQNKKVAAIRFYGENLATGFLLSTSYFDDGKMRYLGSYSPYKRPCQNPFANLS